MTSSRVWQALAIGGLGCGAPNPSAQTPAQAVVVAPAPPEPESEAVVATTFHCTPSRPIEHARVSGGFSTEWLTRTEKDEPTGQKVQDVKVVYTIARLTRRAVASAEIVLERHEDGLPSGQRSGQDGWFQALEGGWIRQGVPFIIERRGETWCWVDQSCPSHSTRQDEFVAQLGLVASLLAPLPEVVAQLDGKPNDGKLSFDLPQLVAKRLGLTDSGKVRVVATGPQIPATFEAVLTSETPSVGDSRQRESTASTVRVQIDEHCRVREASLVLERIIGLPSEPGADRLHGIARRRWRTDPID